VFAQIKALLPNAVLFGFAGYHSHDNIALSAKFFPERYSRQLDRKNLCSPVISSTDASGFIS